MSQDYEAEQNLLGMAMLDSNCAIKLLEIPESWFLLNAHKMVYREISSLVSQSLTVDSIALGNNILGTSEQKNGLDMEYLMQLESNSTSLRHFDSYKKSLFTIYKKKGIESVGNGIIQKLASGDDAQSIISYMQDEVFELLTDHNTGGPKSIQHYLGSLTKQMQQKMANPNEMMGIQSGYAELDEMIGGFEDGKVYLIAARPSIGKSAFGLIDIGMRIACDKSGRPVVAFSLEMTGEALAARAICNKSGLNGNKIKQADMTSDEWTHFAEVTEVISKTSNLFIDDSHGISTAQMRARLKAIELKHGKLGGIIFDHVGIIKKNERKSETEALAQISHELMGFGKEFKCPIIELSQLNRGVEQRENKRPVMMDLKQTSALEEDADVIMMLYRDDYYNENTETPNVTEVGVIKNRDGPTGTLYFNHLLSSTQYSPITGYVKPQPKQKSKGKF